MPFLTDVDERAQVKGSRDPLGLVPIWSRVGREVVGNLSTVTSSVRGFTSLLLGLHFAEEILEIDREAGQSRLEIFLKFEQLAGYARVKLNGDRAVRGLRRVQARMDLKRIRISPASAEQILSNQKVYGLWGLFSMPARASELLEKGDQRLTPAARDFVMRRYVPIFGNGKGTRPFLDLLRRDSFDFEPEGRHQGFAQALAKSHSRELRADEKDFYRDHLAWGGEIDSTGGKQRILAEILAEHKTREFGFDDFRAIRTRAKTRHSDVLTASLDRIEALEQLLSPSRVLFGYLLTRNGQSIERIATDVSKEWKRPPRVNHELLLSLQPDITKSTGSAKAAGRWLEIADAISNRDYNRTIRLLVEMNAEVMQMRGGSAAWLSIENGVLRVRMADETEDLLPSSEVENLWRSTYFINSLWAIARETSA